MSTHLSKQGLKIDSFLMYYEKTLFEFFHAIVTKVIYI